MGNEPERKKYWATFKRDTKQGREYYALGIVRVTDEEILLDTTYSPTKREWTPLDGDSTVTMMRNGKCTYSRTWLISTIKEDIAAVKRKLADAQWVMCSTTDVIPTNVSKQCPLYKYGWRPDQYEKTNIPQPG